MKIFLRWLLGTYLAALVVAAILLVTVWPRLDPGVETTVENRTGAWVGEVAVRYRGGEIRIGRLPPSASGTGLIRGIKGESSATVVFRVHGQREMHYVDVDVYMEKGYTGRLAIFLEPAGKVSREREIKAEGLTYMAVGIYIFIVTAPVRFVWPGLGGT